MEHDDKRHARTAAQLKLHTIKLFRPFAPRVINTTLITCGAARRASMAAQFRVRFGPEA